MKPPVGLETGLELDRMHVKTIEQNEIFHHESTKTQQKNYHKILELRECFVAYVRFADKIDGIGDLL